MTETRDDTVTWLTQEAYDRLKSELDYLSGPGRTEIAKKIEQARGEGDLPTTVIRSPLAIAPSSRWNFAIVSASRCARQLNDGEQL